jgi:hypothetical protein
LERIVDDLRVSSPSSLMLRPSCPFAARGRLIRLTFPSVSAILESGSPALQPYAYSASQGFFDTAVKLRHGPLNRCETIGQVRQDFGHGIEKKQARLPRESSMNSPNRDTQAVACDMKLWQWEYSEGGCRENDTRMGRHRLYRYGCAVVGDGS